MSIRFIKTSFGVGGLVRFKDRKSHRWTYGIYRGVSEHEGRVRGYEFSETPLGPVTRWLAYWPEYVEAAVVSPREGTQTDES